MARLSGNDIASYQGDVNYEIFKNNSNFVIFKVTEGIGFIDPKYKRNQSEARRVGMPLGYYHFARPDLGNSPEQEADFFLKNIGELKEGEVLALDYEVSKIQAHVEWCARFLNYCRIKTGIRPFIYMSESYVSGLDWQTVVDGSYALWIAKYLNTPNPDASFNPGEFKSAAMYQWTSRQQVPGINGNVDGNVFYGDVTTFKKYGYKPAPAPEPPVDWKKKYDDEVKAHNITKGELKAAIERVGTIKTFVAAA